MWLWVDPPLQFLKEGKRLVRAIRQDNQKGREYKKLCDWLAIVWSKHSDSETHWTPSEVDVFIDRCYYQDPGLFEYIMDESRY